MDVILTDLDLDWAEAILGKNFSLIEAATLKKEFEAYAASIEAEEGDLVALEELNYFADHVHH